MISSPVLNFSRHSLFPNQITINPHYIEMYEKICDFSGFTEEPGEEEIEKRAKAFGSLVEMIIVRYTMAPYEQMRYEIEPKRCKKDAMLRSKNLTVILTEEIPYFLCEDFRYEAEFVAVVKSALEGEILPPPLSLSRLRGSSG